MKVDIDELERILWTYSHHDCIQLLIEYMSEEEMQDFIDDFRRN